MPSTHLHITSKAIPFEVISRDQYHVGKNIQLFKTSGLIMQDGLSPSSP